MLMFCVPKSKIPQALGKNGENLKKISEIVKKRIRILPQPRGIEDIEQFIKAIINPVTFNNLEMKEDEIIINAGQQNKAALLGRNKRRLAEMQRIIKDFFGKNYKII
jgi:transcription antitermination factor NusA-like protein